MSSEPRVSVLTPSYNQAEWLADNLGSVSAQTYPHIEHIVVDGGSTDGSVALLEAAGETVRWSSGPDEGQADAINKAFAVSTGDIIGWINSDDAYVDERVVSDVVAFFARNPDVDVAYGHCLQTTADGLVIQVLWAPRFNAELLRVTDFITQPGVFMRRRAIGDLMLDATYHFAMDYELWLRLDAAGRRFARMPRLVGIDRHQAERKSRTTLDVHASDMERLAATYNIHPADTRVGERTRFYLTQRIAGAAWIPRIPRELAFGAPIDPRRGLWVRQLFSRRSAWPEEYR